jgi:hypothetical protein
MQFRSTMTVPPGGEWFWGDQNHYVSDPDFHTAVEKVRSVLKEIGSTVSPEVAMLEYMCPRMPRGFCYGFEGPAAVTASDYLGSAAPYFKMPVALVDDIVHRIEKCKSCPMFDGNDLCLTCRHLDDVIYTKFDGRRVRLPGDRRTGICKCAKTFNMVVASVVYPENSEVWEGTPPTCWRFQ